VIRMIWAVTYLVRWRLYMLRGDERAAVCRAMACQYALRRTVVR
jgi:hypothetical protein